MLKLKVKEKLLNRLNELDVTEVIDSNGNHIAVEDLIAYIESLEDSDLIELLSKISIDEDSNLVFGNAIIDTLDITNECYVKISKLFNNNSEDFDPVFPLVNNAGKVLAVNDDEEGLVAVEKGTILYKHEVYFNTEDDGFIVYSTSPEQATIGTINSLLSNAISIITGNNIVCQWLRTTSTVKILTYIFNGAGTGGEALVSEFDLTGEWSDTVSKI